MIPKCKYCIHSVYENGKLACLRKLRMEPDGIPWFCLRDFERAVGSDDDL